MRNDAKISMTLRQLKEVVAKTRSSYSGNNPDLVSESVDNAPLSLGLITEMAFTKRDYENKAFSLRVQIVDNWCLCMWCRLYANDNPNFRHWAAELAAHITNIRSMKLKNGIDRKRTLTTLFVDKCEMCDTAVVESIIREKFEAEGVLGESERQEAALRFCAGLAGLIGVLAGESGVKEYIDKTFCKG